MRLLLEARRNGNVEALALPGDCEATVAFMSFAISRGFGATHPLIALADRLHDTHHLSLGRFTTFYDASEEDGEDREKRELTWQDAAGLAAGLSAISAAIASDPQAVALLRRAGAEPLQSELEALACLLARLEPTTMVRLGYTL